MNPDGPRRAGLATGPEDEVERFVGRQRSDRGRSGQGESSGSTPSRSVLRWWRPAEADHLDGRAWIRLPRGGDEGPAEGSGWRCRVVPAVVVVARSLPGREHHRRKAVRGIAPDRADHRRIDRRIGGRGCSRIDGRGGAVSGFRWEKNNPSARRPRGCDWSSDRQVVAGISRDDDDPRCRRGRGGPGRRGRG